VVAGIGITPNVDLAKAANLDVSNGIRLTDSFR
jgi:NAD(P)H-nitrite reductase large subunit